MSITLPYIMSDGSVIDAPARVDFKTLIPYGIGEPDPVTYPARKAEFLANGHITAKHVDLYEEYVQRLWDDLTLSEELFFELGMEEQVLHDNEGELRSVATATERLRKQYNAAVSNPLVACPSNCNEHDRWLEVTALATEGKRKVVRTEIPVPDLVQPDDDKPADRYATVPDALRVTWDARSDAPLVQQVMLDGVPGFSYEDFDTNVVADLLPTFSIVHYGDKVNAVCTANVDGLTSTGKPVRITCDGAIWFSDVALSSRSEKANMQAFVLALMEHTLEAHPNTTAQDMCAHGERNFVAGTSRATGQAFAASFCKRGQSRTACEPVWHNLGETRPAAHDFLGTEFGNNVKANGLLA